MTTTHYCTGTMGAVLCGFEGNCCWSNNLSSVDCEKCKALLAPAKYPGRCSTCGIRTMPDGSPDCNCDGKLSARVEALEAALQDLSENAWQYVQSGACEIRFRETIHAARTLLPETMTRKKPRANTGLFPCLFCRRCEGDEGIDVVVIGPVLPDETIVAICNSCAASAISQIRAIRWQRTQRKGKL
jgi:hypothetical protein